MKLGLIGAMSGMPSFEGVRTHLSFGRVADGLASRCDVLNLSIPMQAPGSDETRDYHLRAENIRLFPQPFYGSSAGALKHLVPVVRSYFRVARAADAVLIRGMVPAVGWAYLACWIYRARPVHWLVGNPQSLLKSHARAGRMKTLLYRLSADFDAVVTKAGRRLTGGWLVCNGQEIADLYPSPQTVPVVSSTVYESEFHYRYDAFQVEGRLNILFVGFVRPEKGLEYLVEALGLVGRHVSCRLSIVGTAGGFQAYLDKIKGMIDSLDLEDSVDWVGYIPYGEEMQRLMWQSDVLVLPTLSEGTPRVLVEARANGLPVVATDVGGIPSSVDHDLNGILVPPKAPEAIANAILELNSDRPRARQLVERGYEKARELTLDRFVETICDLCVR
jgi:glycosyltransferase involved in cell wall biosynthesis